MVWTTEISNQKRGKTWKKKAAQKRRKKCDRCFESVEKYETGEKWEKGSNRYMESLEKYIYDWSGLCTFALFGKTNYSL